MLIHLDVRRVKVEASVSVPDPKGNSGSNVRLRSHTLLQVDRIANRLAFARSLFVCLKAAFIFWTPGRSDSAVTGRFGRLWWPLAVEVVPSDLRRSFPLLGLIGAIFDWTEGRGKVRWVLLTVAIRRNSPAYRFKSFFFPFNYII